MFSLKEQDGQMVLAGGCSPLTLGTVMEHKGKVSPSNSQGC